MKDLNIIIKNDKYLESDKHLFFGDEDVTFLDKPDIYEALVLLEVFKSRSEARRNWNRGEMPLGYSEFKKIGKLNKELYILNPG